MAPKGIGAFVGRGVSDRLPAMEAPALPLVQDEADTVLDTCEDSPITCEDSPIATEMAAQITPAVQQPEMTPAEMAMADEISPAIQQWLERAEEEEERDGDGTVELPVQQTEVTPADHRSRSRSPDVVRAGAGAGSVRAGAGAGSGRAERSSGSSAERLAGRWSVLTGGCVIVRMAREGAGFEHAMEFIRSLGMRAFYIGITACPANRWNGLDSMPGHCLQWDTMTVLFEARSSVDTAQLERRLIAACHWNPVMANVGGGGERAGSGSPHYLYIVTRRSGLIRYYARRRPR